MNMRLRAIAQLLLALRLRSATAYHEAVRESNSTTAIATFTNPILPGFHPDPSCIHVADGDDSSDSPGMFFCVSSSFNAFPGMPIHASRDLRHWSLIGHVLNRQSQLPALAETSRSTSGIWAPTIRYHDGTFYVVTTLVHDDRPQTDASRWDNVVFQADDPYDAASWTNPTRFNFTGYDPSPFWDDDGLSYIVASHAWQVEPGIHLAQVDLDTGETGPWKNIWNGTGGLVGPHIYHKDGYYYLLIAEGGTGLAHMVTMARSKTLDGPYTPHPHNPVLTNANTSNYFQTVGHADLVRDSASGHWWAVALATRSGPAYANYPMGRETVLTPVKWTGAGNGSGWPTFAPVRGQMSGPLPAAQEDDEEDDDASSYAHELNGDDIDFATYRSKTLPPHFTYWRPPVKGMYEITRSEMQLTGGARRHAPLTNTTASALRLLPSMLNLTGFDGNYAGRLASGPGHASGQTFVGRRQQHTLFTFRVYMVYRPLVSEEEAGVSVYLTQNHHLDLGIVRLLNGTIGNASHLDSHSDSHSGIHLRFRGITTGAAADNHLFPSGLSWPIPMDWQRVSAVPGDYTSQPLQVTLQIQAANATHYSFSAWPTHTESAMQTVAWASNAAVSYGFTGALVGVYCTTNGNAADATQNGTSLGSPVYIKRWQYVPLGK